MSAPAKYRKKPVVIDAIQWDGTLHGATDIIHWVLLHDGTAQYWCRKECDGRSDVPHDIAISTLEGRMLANPGDWIIKGVNGEFYPCKPDIFAKTYDPETLVLWREEPK